MYFVILSRTFSATAFSAACGGNTVTLSRTFLAFVSSLLHGQETLSYPGHICGYCISTAWAENTVILSRTFLSYCRQYCMEREHSHLVQDIFQLLSSVLHGEGTQSSCPGQLQLLSSVLHGEGTQSSCPGHFSAAVVSTASVSYTHLTLPTRSLV